MKLFFVVGMLTFITVAVLTGTHNTKEISKTVKGLRYQKDSKTGLCFASGTVYIYYYPNQVFTWVPCEEIPEGILEPL